ncbi:MAG: purine-nucleoside phosphorylase [Clostridia bacterium]|nr:purine-nucleoside phosphorylase [Clostridia bacterium]
MATPHIGAEKGDIAKTVLMPGDPKRAEWITKEFLTDAHLFNDIRGALGFTGFYQGKRVSVMASGMGQPSMGIYSYELFKFFDVETIIRVGTSGAIDSSLQLRDLVIAQGACTDGNYALQYRLPGTFCPLADFELLQKAVSICKKKKFSYAVGNVLSSDLYYDDAQSGLEWAKMGVLAVEMEAGSLYCNAARLGRRALCITSISNQLAHPEVELTSKERHESLADMVVVALEAAE